MPAGKGMPDDQLAMMDCYVEGVVGPLPKKQ